MKEEWKDIKDYENLYQVSNLGRIKSLYGKGRILKTKSYENGYVLIDLYKNGKRKKYLVHRLVAEAFIPNPENKPTVDHINTIKDDNRVENLRWFNQKEQLNDNDITKEKRKKINCKKVINLDTDEVFLSAAEASRKYNLYYNEKEE